MTVEDIAKVWHEANRVYSRITGYGWQSGSEEWQRDSVIKGVQFALDNPNSTPESKHEAWYKDMEKDGWRFGFVEDPVKKEHPYMLPYDMLPKEQRVKDKLFQAIVKALAPDSTLV